MNARILAGTSGTLLGSVVLLSWAACSGPTEPHPPDAGPAVPSLKKGGAPGGGGGGDDPSALPQPDPQLVVPSTGEQGQTLSIVIYGADFGEPGEVCAVNWLLGGTASPAITTTASSCVSTTQIDAEISIATDAPAEALYDVEVVIGKGNGRRRGIGSEKFTVKQNQSIVEFSNTFTLLSPVSSEHNDGLPDFTAGPQFLQGGLRNGQIMANGSYVLSIDFSQELAVLRADPALAEQVCIPPDRRDLKGDLRLFEALGLAAGGQVLAGDIELHVEPPSRNGRNLGATVVNFVVGDFFITTGRGPATKVFQEGTPTRVALNGGYIRINYTGADPNLPSTNLCNGIVDYELAVFD